jgi:uncharacterized membrane protein
MISKGFSNGEAFKFGWHAWKKNWGQLLGITLFYFLLPLIPAIVLQVYPDMHGGLAFLLMVIHYVLTAIAYMGFLTISLKVARQEEFSFGDFFKNIHLFPSFLLGYVFYCLGTIVGLILLVVPGIYFCVKYTLWPYFIIDRSFKGLESLKASGQTTYGAKWDLFLFWIGACVVNVIGVLCLGIGIFVSVPVTAIALAYIYNKLTHSTSVEGVAP